MMFTNENWANSEVITRFAENYFKYEAEKATEIVAEPTLEFFQSPIISEATTAEVMKFKQELSALGEIDGVISSLKKLASQTIAAGQIKEAYEIERAIEDIQKIGQDILDGENSNV